MYDVDDLLEEKAVLQDRLARIDKIQQEWWDGIVPMNVALSEIRVILGEGD